MGPELGLLAGAEMPQCERAEGLAFDSNFFTYEYPQFICSEFNDFFVVVMEPRPAGSPDGNIVFDTAGNKVSVNNSLLRACSPGTYGGRRFDCELGTTSLRDTSFDDSAECGQAAPDWFPFPLPTVGPVGASTGWLRTVTPVEAGSVITLRFGLRDGKPKTLDEVGHEFGLTRERIRQIESKTLAKLRHPSRADRLRGYLDLD